MSLVPARPYELCDLADYLGLPRPYAQEHTYQSSALPEAISVRVGVDRNWVHRHIRSGLSAFEADRCAIAFGTHPAMIWPTWFDDALIEPAERQCRRGHEMTPENTYTHTVRGRTSRQCKTCLRISRTRRPRERIAKVTTRPKQGRMNPAPPSQRERIAELSLIIEAALVGVRAERTENLPPETVAVYRKFGLFGFGDDAS